MFLSRIILLPVLVFITAFAAQAQRRDAKDWSIADYFKNLPEKYITASGDFEKPSAATLVVDEKNGYAAAYMAFPPRRGTRMKVSLEICDYLDENTPDEKVGELAKLIDSAKSIYLEWDKQNGKFNLAK